MDIVKKIDLESEDSEFLLGLIKGSLGALPYPTSHTFSVVCQMVILGFLAGQSVPKPEREKSSVGIYAGLLVYASRHSRHTWFGKWSNKNHQTFNNRRLLDPPPP
jgi:hypothetical protein